MTNLTADQTNALDYYAENEQYVQYFGLTNLDREDRLVYRKGKKLMQSVLDIKTTRSHTKYEDLEVKFLVEAYLDTDANMHATRNAFFKAYPDTVHSLSSVYMKISRIRTLDTQYTNDTEWQTDNQVKSVCNQINSNRFC